MSPGIRQSATCAAYLLLALLQCACDDPGRMVPAAGPAPTGGTEGSAVPEAVADYADTTAGGSVRIPVLANDSNTAAGGEPLHIMLVGRPQHGSAELDNNGTPERYDDDTVVYLASPTFVGVDQFSYTVADSAGARASAVVTIDVSRATRSQLQADHAATARNNAVTVPVLHNDTLAADVTAPLELSVSGNGSAVVDDGGTPLDVSDDRIEQDLTTLVKALLTADLIRASG